ncbi:MAG: hypothetical protein SOH48_04735 [Eubacteriales bacterium]|jgi:hypothetical protein
MKKISSSEALHLIAPYVHAQLLSAPYVNFEDVGKIQAALSPYENVSVSLKDRGDGYAYLLVRVSHFLTHTEKLYEIRDHGRRKKMYDNLAWIDAIEAYDALFHD